MNSFITFTCWMLAVFIKLSVLTEIPELEKLPTLESQAEIYTESKQPENHGVCENNRTAIFLHLLYEMQMLENIKTSISSIDEARRSINIPWSKYITPLVEYFYYGDSRHSVFYNSEDGKSNSLKKSEQLLEQIAVKPSTKSTGRANCTLRLNRTRESSVLVVNDTLLQQLLRNEKTLNGSVEAVGSAHCQILLLFAPWCPFSALLAPHYNALGRLFPDMEVLAINALTLNYWNARFGTVAVPNVLLFHNGKFIAKYNYTEKTVEGLTNFVQNLTNLNSSQAVELVEADHLGPVPTELVEETDYYLLLSWTVIIYAIAFLLFRYSTPLTGLFTHITNLFNYDHHHLD